MCRCERSLGVQGGIVAGQTRISPGTRRSWPSSDMITRAVPVTVPGEAASVAKGPEIGNIKGVAEVVE